MGPKKIKRVKTNNRTMTTMKSNLKTMPKPNSHKTTILSKATIAKLKRKKKKCRRPVRGRKCNQPTEIKEESQKEASADQS